MIKDDIVKTISSKLELKQEESKMVAEAIISEFRESLLKNDKLVILNFGTFKKINKKARKGRNPKTGKAHLISKRHVISFKPSFKFIQDLAKKKLKP